MKAISLFQPYASLISVGEKTWETRSRRTHHRGLIAIHATQRTPTAIMRLAETPIFLAALKRHELYASTLPSGTIVAVAEITDCITTTEWVRLNCKRSTDPNGYTREEIEYTFGDYTPGRYAWKLENVIRLANPIPCSGMQFIWTVPSEIEALVSSQLAR